VHRFSPNAAGNVRIDGLFLDQLWGLNPRLRRASTSRVGLSALGSPFPAPTGIVDHAFRKPGDKAALSVLGTWRPGHRRLSHHRFLTGQETRQRPYRDARWLTLSTIAAIDM
jgi:hypothetical protein